MMPRLVLDLVRAKDRAQAEEACTRINSLVFWNGLLSQVSPALASALVHGLWHRGEHSEDLILGLLADIAGGFVDERDSTAFGEVSVEDCLREVCRGYPAYVEILETGVNADSRTACIDLIVQCGLADSGLRDRSIFFLVEAVRRADLAQYRSVIEDSLNEPRAVEGG
ncbi:hypothetical protein SAMN05216553_114112 [Lentzea fradiae]|uniref:Uncharacterized protein n=2 Tax=Lentzea fradiae TaxID=200378 RepID=A0A1G7YS12_9PSEU|nr:hypothetical protein SAMN05216553_114112 [Lentzea fradiae]